MSAPKSFCPYVGLQPYTQEHRDYFFGRERDVRIISSNLYASPLTVLYGASGVGKSSVLLAGVMPHLQAAPRTAVVVFREWQAKDAHQLLKSQCLKAVEAAQKKPLSIKPTIPLDDLLQAAAEEFQGSILIILDQFEEYFLYNPEVSAENFFDAELARAINREEVDANFLIALREDGLAKLDRFRVRIPHLLGNTLSLRHLDLAAAEDAIRKPLAVYRARFPNCDAPLTIEDELVRAILAQVQRGHVAFSRSAGVGQALSGHGVPEIETPFLQLVMTRLWETETAAHCPVLRASTMETLGGAQKIARSYLDGIMEMLEPIRREVCARFFDRLVTPSGSKVAYSVEDLTRYAGDLAADVPAVLKALSESRILRNVVPAPEQPNTVRYEIFHDVLAPAILDWRRRFIVEKEKAEAQKRVEADLEAHRRELEHTRQLTEERARTAEEKLKSAKKLRQLMSLVFIIILASTVTVALVWSNKVKNEESARMKAQDAEERIKMAEESRQQSELSQKAALEDAKHEKETGDKARSAVAAAEMEKQKLQLNYEAVIQNLQSQLDKANKVIADSANNTAAAEEQARSYLASAKKSQQELEAVRAETKILEEKIRVATQHAEIAQKVAERAKADAAFTKGKADAAVSGYERDINRVNVQQKK